MHKTPPSPFPLPPSGDKGEGGRGIRG